MLKAVVGDIVELDVESTKSMEYLVRRASAVWIDLAMQRCRIVVQLTGFVSKSVSEKVSQAVNSLLSLTILPKVGRYGTVNGTDLETFKVIHGCAGEALQIP